MTKPNFTSINVILDRSGSMKPTATETISGFNQFLAEQKKLDGEAVFTLAMFDHEYQLVHDCVPLNKVSCLTSESYVPRGYTALLDAVGRTINATGAKLAAMREEDRPSKVLFLIMTDGEENQSREFVREKIMEMINHQRDKYSWEFVFIGANQDAIAGGASLGIAATHSYAYTSNAAGTRRLFDNVTKGASMYRTTKSAAPFAMANPLDDSDTNVSSTAVVDNKTK